MAPWLKGRRCWLWQSHTTPSSSVGGPATLRRSAPPGLCLGSAGGRGGAGYGGGVTLEEVREALMGLRDGRAPGHDGLLRSSMWLSGTSWGRISWRSTGPF
ncbi:hypothetical protein AAFF_G00382170 [Aldrovandia affinis]|uniref:Uncharacterized protein n=1 Tax=Aldrovandia affinis TaxID=143900 RepID=A0AAD7T8B8_9TELE|nr:hypothetical protein AAFF_G00382170 [Aldrovandia affinis]